MSVIPSQSEYATFQVLANKEFVNFDKPSSLTKEIVEPEEDYVQIDMGSIREDDEQEDHESSEEDEKSNKW